MIPGQRKKKQKNPGEGAFPLEKARKIWNSFDEAGQDMTFEQFYRELCGIADPDKMREDLDAIQMRRAQEQSNRLLIDRGLMRADN